MTDAEFDLIYAESKCDGSRDKIIAYLFDQRKQLLALLESITAKNQREHADVQRYIDSLLAYHRPVH